MSLCTATFQKENNTLRNIRFFKLISYRVVFMMLSAPFPLTAVLTDTDAKDAEEMMKDCYRECACLLDADPEQVETTLLMAPVLNNAIHPLSRRNGSCTSSA